MKKSFLKIFILLFLVIFFSKYNISNASFIGASPTVVATSTCSVGLSCGLVGYWTFDGKDMVSGVARDKSGNNNGGVLENISTSTFYTLGKIGQGFKFDGINDRLIISSPTNLTFNTAFTLSTWIKTGTSSTAAKEILGRWDGIEYGYMLAMNETASKDHKIRILIDKDVGGGSIDAARASVNPINDNIWHHVVGVYDGPNSRLDLYVDGVLSSAGLEGTVPPSISNQSRPFYIGNDNGNTRLFSGNVDEVRVYNRALSASEISQLYSSGASTKQGASPTVTATSTCSVGLSCGLVGYWTFDGKDMVRGVAQDKSGNNNKGILENISTSTFYALGKIGQGFNLDGVDDAVRASDSSSLDISDTQSVTQSAWVYSTSFASYPQIIEKRGNYELRVNTTGNVDTAKYFSNTTRCRRTATNPIALHKWYHVVSVAVNTDCPEIYINGILQSSSGTPDAANYEITHPLGIGNRSVTNTNQLVGKLDDIRIYNRALSASEITQLYSIGTSTKQGASPTVTATSTCSSGLSCGLIGYWTFDGKDMVRGVARDKSGNGNHGNLINISTSTFYALGKIGQGFNFDGVNDRVNIGDKDIFDGNTAMTWSFWFMDGSYSVNSSPFAKGAQGSGTNSVWSVYESSTGLTLRLVNSTPTTAGNAIITYPFNGKWVHLTWTYDGSFIRGYKDGVEVMTPVSFTGILNSTSDALTFGNDSVLFNQVSANMDEVRIYNRALSASEIRQLYGMGR